MELTKETLQKVRCSYLIISHLKKHVEELEADMYRLVREETGINDGEVDLEKGIVVNGSKQQ